MRGTLFFIVAVVITAMGCKEEPKPKPIRPVRSIVVTDAATFETRWWPGRAQAAQEVELSFEASGKIIELDVKEGDKVKAGTVVARIDPRDFDNALLRARAELSSAKALRDRVRAAGRAVSAQDLTDAQARYNQALAQVEIQLKAVEDTHIVAPFDGTVVRKYFDNFQNVQRKEPVIRFLDVSALEMVIQIPEDNITLVDRVREVKVRFDAFEGVEIPATIAEVSKEASRTTRTYPVTIRFKPPSEAPIQPGMAGEASGRVAGENDPATRGVEVPISALFAPPESSAQSSFVWIIDEAAGQVASRKVELGELTKQGILVHGLSAGERVVTAGTHTLREGQKVRIQ